MAVHALITGAPTRAPILDTVLARFESCTLSPATPLTLSLTTREWLGDMVETLLAIFDHADGDAELEDGGLDRCLAGEDGPPIAPGFDAQWRAAA